MKLKSILLTTVATISLATATMAQVPNYVPTNGLVGWWPFNGNANDESGNGNNGAVNGATLSTDRFGNTNKAYTFDGNNDAISIDNLFDYPSKSINVWINPTVIDLGARVAVNIDSPPLINGANVIRVEKINNEDKVGATGANSIGSFIENDASLNTWQMITMVKNQVTTLLYYNGNLVGSINSGTYNSTVNGLNKTIFGADRNMMEYWFSGLIDDIGIWNRELNQQEITDLYNGNICYQTITVTDTLLINMGITGFNPVTYNNTIKIFPNPTNDHITIDYGNVTSLNGYELKIINSLSQQVFQTNITQKSNYLNLTTWGGNGLYFVQIIDPEGNIVDIRKIVLQ